MTKQIQYPTIDDWQMLAVCVAYEGQWEYLPDFEAISECEHCPLMDACLRDALAREGNSAAKARSLIWGGKTPNERWRIYRESQAEEITCTKCQKRLRKPTLTGICGECSPPRKKGPLPIIDLTCVTCGARYRGKRGIYCPDCAADRARENNRRAKNARACR